ncbi:hypothetical protein G3480_01435 [Thiorhodococcus mannitoliphagus]|uniref:DUF7931 domain-containing protein n=1 Tax=Thiorhodococcus mannitoliphagus TaxID=329406 RepID=A0A6P1DM47_9GAMM|nr:hypothetical protein [Thiorhodococcus mannitoliphagus]NEX18989.1 hypothetical protein [Thiorhodococcus mannitoliphagus]
MHLTDDENPQLGTSRGSIELDRIAAIRDISALLASQARRELLVFGRTLESNIYDQEAFLDAVRQLALARPVLSVRILVFDPRDAATSGHRLVELARRLTSRIAIRRVDDDDRERLDAFLIADERGFIRRRLAETMEAVADFNAPLEARRLRSEFNLLWERGATDPELRRLSL